MKLEYILQLWNSFNKKIWGNKQFSIFLYIFIILGTVLLRQSPKLYYGFIEHPIYITLLVIMILGLSSHNMILSILLTISVISLYYPSINHSIEGFEDDEESDGFKLKTVDPTDNNIDLEENSEEDIEEDPEEDLEEDLEKDLEEEKIKKKVKSKENFKDKDKKNKKKGLEDINPEFFIKKEKDDDESNDKGDKKDDKIKNKETFLGELRDVFNDLDSGRNKMNAKTAIKQITDIIYNKRRNEVEQILKEEDDSDSDTSSDEDYF